MAIIIRNGLSADTTATTTTAKTSFDWTAVATKFTDVLFTVIGDQSTAYINDQKAQQELELKRLGYEGQALQDEVKARLLAMDITEEQTKAATAKTNLINTILIGVFGAAMIGGGIYVVKTVNKSKKRR